MSDNPYEGAADDVDPAEWAAGLTPDGAPGAYSQFMRAQLGDAGYEKLVAHNEAVSKLSLQKHTSITQIYGAVAVYSVLYGFVGLVAAIAAVAKFIF